MKRTVGWRESLRLWSRTGNKRERRIEELDHEDKYEKDGVDGMGKFGESRFTRLRNAELAEEVL